MLRRFRLRPLRGRVRIPDVGAGNRRRSFVRAGTFLAVVVVAGVVIAAGSAGGTTTKPYTASFDSGPLAGGGTVHVNLAIKNLANPQALGSANVAAASSGSSSFTILGATASQGDATVASGVLQLRNLNLAPGATLTVDLTVKTPCQAGSYTWSLLAKQSNSFNGPPGNDFTLQTAGSNLVTALAGTCRLVWGTQPTTAKVNTTITGTAADPGGPSVDVKAVDGDGNLLTSATGTVTLNKSAGTFTTTGAFGGTTASLVGGVATFSGFTSNGTGQGFTVYASSPGFVSTADSAPPFDIYSDGTACTLGLDCSLPGVVLDSKTNVDATATGGAFTFLSITPYSVPLNVTQPGGGCANFQTTGAAGFLQGGGRVSDTGDLLFTYYVNKSQIQKRYGNNNGQQFIPLCAGAAKVDAAGNMIPCTAQGVPYGPWRGKELNADGNFSGNVIDAVCDVATGMYWSVMGSFQDYTNPDPAKRIDPALNPTVTSWDSNATQRFFNMRVPSPWDWRVGG
jgi:hypothetical protein